MSEGLNEKLTCALTEEKGRLDKQSVARGIVDVLHSAGFVFNTSRVSPYSDLVYHACALITTDAVMKMGTYSKSLILFCYLVLTFIRFSDDNGPNVAPHVGFVKFV